MHKEAFLQTEAAKQFSGMAATLAFEEAVKTTNLICASRFAGGNDHMTAAANAYRLEGANNALLTLVTLTKIQNQITPTRSGKLDHSLK